MTFHSFSLGIALAIASPLVVAPQAWAQTTSPPASGSSVPAPPTVAPVVDVVPAMASDSALPAIPVASPVPPLPSVAAVASGSAPLEADLSGGRSDSQPASASATQAPAGPGFHIHWPPVLPPLLSVEAGIGPRFGSGYTYFPAFPETSVGSTPVPDPTKPLLLASESRSANAFGGDAKLDLNIPALAPEIGVNFESRGGASSSNPELLDAGTVTALSVATPSDNVVTDVLPARTLGIYGRLLGMTVGYRNLAWSAPSNQNALPDPNLGSNPAANVLMVAYDMSLPIGPVVGDANLAVGGGPVSGNSSAPTKDIVAPQEGSLSLALKLYGIEVEAGVRGESLLFASDPSQLFSLFNLSSLAANATNQPASQAANAAQSAVQSVVRFSYTWGPFVQAGVSF